MKGKIFLLLIIITLFSCKKNSTENIQEIADYAITNVTLIDGTGKDALPNTSVLIKNKRILKIVKGSVEVKADSIIDGTGKYLIPGLFDNHFHFGDNIPREFKHLIHFGVTNVFIPGSTRYEFYPTVHKYDSLVRTNAITGPVMRWSSPFITVPGGHPSSGNTINDDVTIYRVTSMDEIPAIVEEAKENGAIALKLVIEDGKERGQPVEIIKPELLQKILEEANKHELLIVTHISDKNELAISIEHKTDAVLHGIYPGIDWEKDMDLLQKMKEQNMYWTQTEMIGRAFLTYPLHPELLESEYWKVFDKEKEILKKDAEQSKQMALGIINNYFNMSLEEWENQEDPMEKVYYKKLDSLGINLVIGTDKGVPNLYNASGIGVHETMQLYQDGGMKPIRIIKSATFNAAKMLKIDEEYGSIEVGKYANLVLLDKNPLEDIANTLSINKVIKQGNIQKRITNANNGYK